VLIVEDEPEFMRRFTNAVLSDSALALAGSAATARTAIAMIDAQPPDVILLDLGCPTSTAWRSSAT
jgi:chemotaxis response regulator CheB